MGREWWEGFFDRAWLEGGFGAIPEEQSRREAELIAGLLDLKPGMEVLDLCCGIGRISVPLAESGCAVTALDIQDDYLRLAAERAGRAGVGLELLQADMREIPFTDRFDAVINFFTSFGYFEQEADNQLTINSVFKSLKPGGRFLLELVNRDYLMAHYQPRGWSREADWLMFEERSFDYAASRNVSRVTWRKPDGGLLEYEVNLRVYSLHELIRMFGAAGLAYEFSCGDLKDRDIPADKDRIRMVIVGRRP